MEEGEKKGNIQNKKEEKEKIIINIYTHKT